MLRIGKRNKNWTVVFLSRGDAWAVGKLTITRKSKCTLGYFPWFLHNLHQERTRGRGLWGKRRKEQAWLSPYSWLRGRRRTQGSRSCQPPTAFPWIIALISMMSCPRQPCAIESMEENIWVLRIIGSLISDCTKVKEYQGERDSWKVTFPAGAVALTSCACKNWESQIICCNAMAFCTGGLQDLSANTVVSQLATLDLFVALGQVVCRGS